VVPLLHGAGTKQKVIQALMVGTPTVSSSVGVEGLGILSGQHALLADDPASFAAHVSTLIHDEDLWRRIAVAGRAHVVATHGRDAVRERFAHAISAVLARQPKTASLVDMAGNLEEPTDESYRELVQRIAHVVTAALRPGAHVAVVSKGDEALLNIEGMTASHFPCTVAGQYAGHYPADSGAAIAHLERQRNAGAEYLLFPRTAFWWLDHYTQFREYLESHYSLFISQSDTCMIFDLHP
jgi:hypothetical protein